MPCKLVPQLIRCKCPPLLVTSLVFLLLIFISLLFLHFFFNPIPTSLFPTIPFPLIFFHFPNLIHPVSCVYCFPISSISQSRTSMFYFLFPHPHFQRAHQKCAPCCIKAQQRSLRHAPPINIQKCPQRIILCVVFLDYLFLQRFILCAVSCKLFIFCNGLF